MTTWSRITARTLFRRLPSTTTTTTCCHTSYVNDAATLCQRGISSTRLLLEKRTIQLPGLGDSITEGTIVEWAVSVGQAVKEGDVVAMVETDKVTVDIKATMNGVVVQQFPAVYVT